MENAEPQTIEADDGFPISNIKFCAEAQEVMAVIHNNKPVAATTFKEGYFHKKMVYKIENNKVTQLSDCKEYTYSQVYNASKSVDLLRFPFRDSYFYFLRHHIKDAYILYKIWFENHTFGVNYKSEKGYTILNIIVGTLLGYKKKDIRAWFVRGLEQEFKMDFDNPEQRKEFIRDPKFIARKDEIVTQFEKEYKVAAKKLADIKEKIHVPESWLSKTSKLSPPPSMFSRFFGRKTAGRRYKNKYTTRRTKSHSS
jgi:hypothetical protein